MKLYKLAITAGVILLAGCSSTPLEKKRAEVLDCTKDLIGYDAYPVESYKICRDLHSRQPRKHEGQLK